MRPSARLALRLGFAFYPLLAALALGWLAWDWTHARNLAAVEDAVFDTVIAWRPVEPKPSGQVVIVEIDRLITVENAVSYLCIAQMFGQLLECGREPFGTR